MQDSLPADRWVAVARRLLALAAADGDAQVSIATAAGADTLDEPDDAAQRDDDADGVVAAAIEPPTL